jgi:tetratricopeptide (TPR) repeat protein
LWKAAQLFDEAGEPMRSIEVYDRFVVQRPRDPRVPEGMLAIGRLYQSAGMFDKAIPVYRKNMEKNAKTPAAYTSAVNVARCYMMLGGAGEGAEKNFQNAEKALLSLVQDNEDILPTANEYRISLFTLGELYYRNKKWADAILRLEEALARYPNDPGVPRALFMLAETYRKSALEIDTAMKKEGVPFEQREALGQARTQRFERSMALFGKVIATLDADFERGHEGEVAVQKPPEKLTALQEEFLRTAYMERAGCAFAMGDYAGAIKLYDVAATRFSQDVTAIEAYLQIVNAYQAMKEPSQASAAAERARWVLKRIPDNAFGKGTIKLTRQYYEDLLVMSKGT